MRHGVALAALTLSSPAMACANEMAEGANELWMMAALAMASMGGGMLLLAASVVAAVVALRWRRRDRLRAAGVP
jgi:hypothetical protein